LIKILIILTTITLFFTACEDMFLDLLKRENNYFNNADGVYFKISDTDQSRDYTAITGEDSDIESTQPNFTDNSNGTITDNITKLLWTKCSASDNQNIDTTSDCSSTIGLYNWSEAKNFCENLDYANRTDWRLPTISELFSLVNFNSDGSKASIDTDYFPNTEHVDCTTTQNEMIWIIICTGFDGIRYLSSTEFKNSETAWGIHFEDGHTNLTAKENNGYVRCIAGQKYKG